MVGKEYFRLRDNGPEYIVFQYIESDEEIFMSSISICDKLNKQERLIRKLKKNNQDYFNETMNKELSQLLNEKFSRRNKKWIDMK